MDWLRRYHAVIVCDEKLVQVPYGNETLTFCGNESSNGRESRLTVISCSKAQEYMAKGCQLDREFQIYLDLVPGAAHRSSTHIEIGPPSEMKELSEQLQELSDKDEREHEEHLKTILELLKEKVVTQIESIKDWASPKTPTEIRQFQVLLVTIEGSYEDFRKIAKSNDETYSKGNQVRLGRKGRERFPVDKAEVV
ncbi:hypothetical protein Tco_1562429 [Tanacetum coccineum]